jgi:hypothetical protein
MQIRERAGGLVDFVTEHNRLTLLVMLVLTGAVVAGIPQLDTGSAASGSADQFENIDRVQAQQYILEHYSNESEQRQRTRRTIQTVYVSDEDGTVLSRESLLAGLRYQRAVADEEAVQAALHEDGIRGLENLVARRVAGDRNATLDEQITATVREHNGFSRPTTAPRRIRPTGGFWWR